MKSPETGNWIVIEGQDKKCPQCAETIQGEARVCQFCEARFEVMVRGYCPKDHEQVPVDDQGRCPRCGSEVVDRHMVSRHVPEPGAGIQTAIASAGAAPTEGTASTPTAPSAAASSGGQVPTAAPPKRPGCLTVYAILLFAGGLAAGLGMMVGGVQTMRSGMAPAIMLAIGGLIAALLSAALARGLWRLRNWARITVMVLQSLGMVGYIAGIFGAFAMPTVPGSPAIDPMSSLCSGILGVVISASILGWFVRHRAVFDPARAGAAGPYVTEAVERPRAVRLRILALLVGLAILAIGAVLISRALRPRASGLRPANTLAVATLGPATATRRPSSTPTRTPTPPPVEITFDDLPNYPVGSEVILTGRLALFSSTRCGVTCGLLLEDIDNPSHEITIFVDIPSSGQTAAPNEMDQLPDQYLKSDIRVRTADGTYAAVGFRIRITGEICETTSGEPCIRDITKIELVTVN